MSFKVLLNPDHDSISEWRSDKKAPEKKGKPLSQQTLLMCSAAKSPDSTMEKKEKREKFLLEVFFACVSAWRKA